ncbi:hypothetical protein Nepgr_022120 [Nepenthes gracilis]|uniref:Uncharacterized protein n=1 Tax=Nepenthes gracilis TaxID=150966 RepID=A0AAD3XXR1_NEPGR|nr:hypothetical protein Nepgr_022120 [Nepenthes gracilis]
MERGREKDIDRHKWPNDFGWNPGENEIQPNCFICYLVVPCWRSCVISMGMDLEGCVYQSSKQEASVLVKQKIRNPELVESDSSVFGDVPLSLGDNDSMGAAAGNDEKGGGGCDGIDRGTLIAEFGHFDHFGRW